MANKAKGKKSHKKLWITLIIILCVLILFCIMCVGISNCAKSSSDEAAVETEEVVQEPQWFVYSGLDVDVNVSGDAKQVNIALTNDTSAESIMVSATKITIGDTTYRLSDGQNGFEGIPLISYLNGVQTSFFAFTPIINTDETDTITLAMADGSDLPTKIKLVCDESEFYIYSDNSRKTYNMRDEQLNLTYGIDD